MVEDNMDKTVGGGVLSIVEGDITQQDTEAIVNAANKSLLGGGGVDGAIHRAGGPAILQECRKIGGCETGEAVITTGGNLKASHVIHTVGPVYRDGSHNEARFLADAYRNSLRLATSHNIKSVAFPSISTGAYRYPMREAAGIALGTALDYLRNNSDIKMIRFVLFGREAYNVYTDELKALTGSP